MPEQKVSPAQAESGSQNSNQPLVSDVKLERDPVDGSPTVQVTLHGVAAQAYTSVQRTAEYLLNTPPRQQLSDLIHNTEQVLHNVQDTIRKAGPSN